LTYFQFLPLTLLMLPVTVAPQNQVSLSSLEEIKADIQSVPCKNQDRRQAAIALFKKMGALDSDVVVEKLRGVENVIVRKQGASAEIIVIGAHYDKVVEGCGAIDNWTGIVALAHIFRSVKQATPNKTILFVAFDHEENGLRGSRAMTEAIDKTDLPHYCAMVNVDSLGLAGPQVLDNVSSHKLEILAAAVANDLKIPFTHASVNVADADSSSFMAKKIPAVTIHGLNTNWMRILHTSNDQPSQIRPLSVYLGYQLLVSMLVRLDSASCAAYR